MDEPNGESSSDDDSGNMIFTFITSYGWILLAGIFAVLYLLRDQVLALRRPLTSARQAPGDADVELLQRQKDARDKLQGKYDEAAKIHAEKQKEKDAENLRRKLEERNRGSQSSGQRLGSTPSDLTTIKSSLVKKSSGARLRGSDYNPLSGTSGSSGYRPSGSSRNCGPKGG